MQAEIIDPTAESVPADWDLFRKQEGLLAAWQAAALTAVAWCAPRPVFLGLVRDGGQVAGIFAGDLAGPPRRHGGYCEPGSPPLTGWFECRLLLGFTSGFAFASRLDAKDRIAVLAAFEKALRRRLGRHCLGILYRQVTADMLPMVGRRFRPRIATAPNTLLPNRWSDLEEYFAGLPRDRRRRLRRIHAEAAEQTQVLRDGDAIDPEQASLLAHLTRLKHGDRVPPIPPRYFRSLNGEDGVRYFGHRDQERLLAFDLAFDDGRRLVTTVTGSLDVRDGGRRNLYFDLYLQEIEHMIARGRAACEFGKGMAELKQRFGCELIPQALVVAAW
ncbi:GNAT family N-acetyltransferase [Sphaerisporangium perillae]|uniref:GNAT family N-acetyltransferase n=1 Tax=Sphaerisporangium perillae TaxID=2935860 RepID=UPI00200EAEA0|nr:GNAT family N-acetyltransferase [Sphaerisporangium perillae]